MEKDFPVTIASHANSTESGFTLIELSIVLVIIGLVVGGILTGQELIFQASIRQSISQAKQLETTYYTFINKYNCVPGDCSYTTSLFDSTYTTFLTTWPASTLNCTGNGDGNGLIDVWQCESMQAAESLFLSNILPNTYKSSSPSCSAKWGGFLYFYAINDSCGYLYNGDLYGAHLGYNALTWATYSGNASVNGEALSPVQAQSIDTKMDDGIPTSGRFMGFDAATPTSNGTVTVGSCVTAGAYNQNKTFTCRAMYYFK